MVKPSGRAIPTRSNGARASLDPESQELRVDYAPGESSTGLFGGNSNWRGPVWFPVNYLLIEALDADDPHFRELLLFQECFHGETGRGIGASHQTGWTALVLRFLEDAARPPATRHARRPGAGASSGEHRP